jgi:hypothetical protein
LNEFDNNGEKQQKDSKGIRLHMEEQGITCATVFVGERNGDSIRQHFQISIL